MDTLTANCAPPLHGETDKLLMPILVVGLGRSGTTLLMSHLGRDTRCLFDRTHAYETKVLGYTARFAQTMSKYPLFKPEMTLQPMRGFFPASSDFCIGTGERSTDTRFNSESLFLAIWKSITDSSLENNQDAFLYAEKCSPWVSFFIRKVMPVFTIFLFRDPRNLYLSQVSFFGSRGTIPSDPTENALRLAREFNIFHQAYLSIADNDDVMLLRYEDLVSDPDRALLPLTQKLGWTPSLPLSTPRYEKHRTTESPEASISRWRHEELPAEVDFYFDQLLPDFYKALEYEPGSNSSAADRCRISFTDELPPGAFTIHNADTRLEADRSLSVHALASDSCIIIRKTQTTPKRISRIWLCVSATGAPALYLYWRKADEPYSNERMISQQYEYYPHATVMSFNVGEHAQWSDDFHEFFISGIYNANNDRACHHRINWLMFVPAPGP